MPSINVRNLPDELHDRISRSAVRSERSLEAEVRYTLAAAYPNSSGLSLKQEWMQATAERLHALVEQLKADGFWRNLGKGTPVQLAAVIGEETPARMLGWMDGTEPLSYEGASRISAFTGCSQEWLISGDDSMFAYTLMDNDYKDFFLPDSSETFRFHLIRPDTSTGFGQVPLLVIREAFSYGKQRAELAYFGNHFHLSDGMGGGGNFKLKRFLQFLKRHSSVLKLSAYILDIDYHEPGSHHPRYYLNKIREHESSWLDRMLKGEAPPWLTEFSAHLDEVKNTPVESVEEGE